MTIYQTLLAVVNYDMYISQLFESAVKAANYDQASIYCDFHEFLHVHCSDLIRLAQAEELRGPFRLNSEIEPDDQDPEDDDENLGDPDEDSISGPEIRVGPDGNLS